MAPLAHQALPEQTALVRNCGDRRAVVKRDVSLWSNTVPFSERMNPGEPLIFPTLHCHGVIGDRRTGALVAGDGTQTGFAYQILTVCPSSAHCSILNAGDSADLVQSRLAWDVNIINPKRPPW